MCEESTKEARGAFVSAAHLHLELRAGGGVQDRHLLHAKRAESLVNTCINISPPSPLPSFLPLLLLLPPTFSTSH